MAASIRWKDRPAYKSENSGSGHYDRWVVVEEATATTID